MIGPVAVTGDGQLGGVNQIVEVFDEGGVIKKLLWIGRHYFTARSNRCLSAEARIDSFGSGASVGLVGEPEITFCYRHRDRRSGVICQRCDRPICGDCQNTASVGFHCPECTHTGKQQVIRGPVRFDPITTKVLIGLTVMISLAVLSIGGSLAGVFGRPYQELVLLAPLVDQGDYYRVLSGAVIHNGLLPLGLNMGLLWFVGGELERRVGRARYLVVYGIGCLGGAFAALLFAPMVGTFVPSGPVFACLGAVVVLRSREIGQVFAGAAGPLAIVNVLFAISPFESHVAGFLTGVAVAGLYLLVERSGADDRLGALVIGIGGGAATLVACLWASSLWLSPLF